MGTLEMMNPAELHRECVRLEHQNDLLEKKLGAKDVELRASWGEIQNLEHARAALRTELDAAQHNAKDKAAEVVEMSRTTQALIANHAEWRDREIALQRKAEVAETHMETFRAKCDGLQGELHKLQKTITHQDQQIQHYISKRQEVTNRLNTPVASRSSQTDWALDEQEKKLITAESVATAGMNEAKTMKVEMQQLKRKLARLEASNVRANEACGAYKTGCEALQEEIEHLSKEVANARQEHTQDRTNLLAQLRASEQRERDLHTSIETIKKRDMSVEEAKNEVDKLGARASEAHRKENMVLREDSQALHAALQAARSESDDYQQKYLHLMKTLQAVREQADEHRRQTSEDIQNLNRENAEVFNDYTRLREEKAELRDELREAEQRLAAYTQRGVFKVVETQTVPFEEPGTVQDEQLIADLEQEVMVQRNHADKLQGGNSQLANQVNMLLAEVAELKKDRLQQATSPSALKTDKLEIERLQLQVTNLREELGRKKTISPPPPPPAPSSAPAQSGAPAGAMSPPTKLQALADDLDVLQTPPANQAMQRPMHQHYGQYPNNQQADITEAAQSALAAFEGLLVKLINKLAKVLKNCNTFRVYVEDAIGETGQRGIPIHRMDKYPGQNWNKLFEVVSGIKLCFAAIEQKGMAMVSQNIVMKRQMGILPEEQGQPGEGREMERGREVQMEMPAQAEGEVHESDDYRVVVHEADTDSDASSQPGEDLDMCTQLIQDTDTLLRATHGAEHYWGDARIDNLRQQLSSLQHEAVHVPASLPSPLPETGVRTPTPIPASLHTSPIRRSSQNTMRWDAMQS
eukprot:TRINITY_DN21465_c0_g1_i1.p1 TRINITY_DN21465_c0_g1~~TRINITY_DN21465_c0_g1_i1.p1  ORF type:complete len:810 (+),score=314.53 TRINITY_DN21465_c0_g1_i1:136-2565(+)